jgi:hypothetical protein
MKSVNFAKSVWVASLVLAVTLLHKRLRRPWLTFSASLTSNYKFADRTSSPARPVRSNRP